MASMKNAPCEPMKASKNKGASGKTPKGAVGRDGGASPKAPSDKIQKTKVPMKSLKRSMKG